MVGWHGHQSRDAVDGQAIESGVGGGEFVKIKRSGSAGTGSGIDFKTQRRQHPVLSNRAAAEVGKGDAHAVRRRGTDAENRPGHDRPLGVINIAEQSVGRLQRRAQRRHTVAVQVQRYRHLYRITGLAAKVGWNGDGDRLGEKSRRGQKQHQQAKPPSEPRPKTGITVLRCCHSLHNKLLN